MAKFSTIILAAGKGTRMNSPLPKLVHPVAGRPMIERVVRTVRNAGSEDVRVVVGYGEEMIRPLVEPLGATCFKQERQLGTADAVRAAQPENLDDDVLILNGDHPLLEVEDLNRFREEFRSARSPMAVVTCELKDPAKFGRIIRHQGRLRAIVEAKDASHETLKIKEINTAIYLIHAELLNMLLPQIKSENAQGEFYLTDLVSLAVDEGVNIETIKANSRVALGVNTQAELARATRTAFRRKAQRLMEGGVIVMQPTATFVEDSVEVESAAVLYPNVYLRGSTKIGAYAVVEPGTTIVDSSIGNGVHIKSGCYIDSAKVAAQAALGPYAHLRPGTDVGEDCKIGNFVELKKVKFGKGSKASHLSYIGDAEVGANTNIGCGTITCNYAFDHQKYVTKIGNNVFVGSDTQLIAPVSVGDGAFIASGSTITRDVPAGALAGTRGEKFQKENYKAKAPANAAKDSAKKEK